MSILGCMNLELKLGNKEMGILVVIIIALFSSIFLGFTGFKVLFGMMLVFFLPFYLIFDVLELSFGEKAIFSLFVGIGLFSSIVYWLGVFMSFKVAVVLSFVLVMLFAILFRTFMKKRLKTRS